MISPLPKPPRPFSLKSIPGPKPERLPKRASMTIALGLLCGGGAIVAADTRSVNQGGSSTRGRKVAVVDTKEIAFAIAEASEDANATEALVRKIASHLGQKKPTTWNDLESEISAVMTEWAYAFSQGPPATELIGGITIPKLGTRLYFCQPPNTVLPKLEGYVSVGSGAHVTDPLFRTLFYPCPQSRNAQVVLREISYLMYRSKGIEGNAYTGGQTDGVFLDTAEGSATWINATDLRDAEAASFQLDILLNATASIALSQPDDWLAANRDHIGDLLVRCDRLRQVVFRDLRGRILGQV
jgi:20S proteasome alpha/beta subunit